ncbi:PAS domain S-box protein, partial [Candidatus Aerophobetes bacterium]
MSNHNLRASSTKLETASKELEQKVAELKESEEKYRSLFETANDAIFMVNLQGYISFANPKFFEVMGYSPQELEKLHFTHLVHPDDVSLVMNRFKRRLAGEEVETNYQFRALTKDKRVVYVDGNFSLVKKEGKVIGIQAIARDITQRKYLEKNLEERTKQLKALYDTTRRVASSLSLDEVLSTITQESANLLKVDGAIIRLLDAEHKMLEVVKAHNLKTDYPGQGMQGVGEGVLGRILLEGKPIVVQDVQKDPRYLRKEWAKKEGFISFLGVPLESKKKIIGTLAFLSRRKRLFQKKEVSLALAFANQTAVAIENAQLYEEQKRSLLERKKLHEISVASSSKLDTSSILKLIVESALELTGAKRATIRLLTRDKKKVEKALY